MARALVAVGWLALWTFVAVAMSAFGKRYVGLGVALAMLATLWLALWLPRMAHAAFQSAHYAAARRRYRVLGALAVTRRRARAAQLSVAACRLAAGERDAAEAMFATLGPAALEPAERVVWLNNRACAELDAGRDPAAALALADEAIALRPDVPGVQHTRARALIALGRLDDAIAVLEAMRAGGELPLRLEAERCRDLATAWEKKGQGDYAADYRDRARLHAI
jgi:predicted Zn-dependent protease